LGATFLTGAAILHAGAWLHGHGVMVQGGVIRAVLPEQEDVAGSRIALPAGSLLAPGLLDVQVNGGGGLLFNDDPSAEAARAIAATHRRLGTTSILPTLITDTPEMLTRAALAAETGAGVIGLHVEGPFLSQARPGVHQAALIRAPEESDLLCLSQLAARLDGPVLLTLAPETVSPEMLRRLRGAGVVLSAGHSAATFEQCEAALAAGVTGFTHLFNAMPPPSARAPGIVAAALLNTQAWCGVIADGIHVHPAMLRLLRASRPGRVMLVSDAMPPTGTDTEVFELQGRTIYRREGCLRAADGTLAGADLCLMEAVRRAVSLMGISPAQALTMASEVPADFLGVGCRLGHLAPGRRADMVLLTEGLDVIGTWLAGSWDGEEVLAGGGGDGGS
jgi:N-acetylglucosamine-6-phosphate deacetylase